MKPQWASYDTDGVKTCDYPVEPLSGLNLENRFLVAARLGFPCLAVLGTEIVIFYFFALCFCYAPI